MTWWQWGLAVLVTAAGIAFGGFKYGVTTQRKDDADARLRLAASIDSVQLVHAADVAKLKVDVSRFSTLATLAEARATAAESKAQRSADDVLSAQDALRASQTTGDSLRAYPPIVEALTRQVEAGDSVQVALRDALTASHARAGVLLARIAADSTLIQRQAATLATIVPVAKVQSGWACVAGLGAVTGARTGLGLGVTCGRRL